jgi:lycopene beta-cyclase
MSGTPHFDVAILGGGLAGLSLAVRLCQPRFAHLRVLVLEARESYVRDRTWCYWRTGAHPFEAAVTCRWQRWAVAGRGGHVERSAEGVRYECIPADRFYDLALAHIVAAPNVELRRGVQAEATEEADCVRLQPCGLRARLAFDARPPARLGRYGLAQRFLGQEIEVERPIFDPECAMLMDLQASTDGVHFTYVLPASPTRALVEDAWFAPPGAPPPDHRAALARWLAAHGAGRHRVLFEESGCLPMDPRFRPTHGRRLMPLGAAAGAHRPATGYAFGAVQAQCDFICDQMEAALDAGRMPGFRRRAPAVRSMDRLMLATLARRPQLAPQLFFGLFTHCPAARLVRFLADRPGFGDMAAVILATARGLAAGAP